MFVRYYGLCLGFAASISLALAGCAPAPPPGTAADPTTGAMPAKPVVRKDDDQTDKTIWTVLGLGKRESEQEPGPKTGPKVSPVLWEAVLDTVHFAGTGSEDAQRGLIVTKWYSPPAKPNERLRVSVFILSRALRSDSMAVTVEREVRSPDGNWQPTAVAMDVVEGWDPLESTCRHASLSIL